jgi:hypothetical protein
MIERVTNVALLFIFSGVCVPLYCEVRLVLPIWDGMERSQIIGLRSTLRTLWGAPQSLVDWTNLFSSIH